jgi:hypothetical protein
LIETNTNRVVFTIGYKTQFRQAVICCKTLGLGLLVKGAGMRRRGRGEGIKRK